MKLQRRQVLRCIAGAISLPALPDVAWSSEYPGKMVRIIVGFPGGQPADVTARMVADQLSQRLGQPFIVENRPGAGTNIAAEAVVRAAPDGYTLLCAAAPNAINAALDQPLKFDFLRDVTPVASLVRVPFLLVVNPALQIRSVPELIDYAKAHPRSLNYASSGIGSLNHMAGELLKLSAGIEMTHVPYKGTMPGLTDLMKGEVQVMFADAAAIPYAKSGQVRALAVTTDRRLAQLPDVAPINEHVADFTVTGFLGIVGPAGIPAEVVSRLNAEINAALSEPSTKSKLEKIGYAIALGSPQSFKEFLEAEVKKWRRVTKAANIQPDR
jgi:tripartite-type tricarboxylate transporter receptor subunit TctC